MPSGTLPNAGSLGDPQITTGDYQTQINQLLGYVRSLQAEMAALSDTTIREGAVRGVGESASELVDTTRLNTRIGTSGNLGTIAVKSENFNGNGSIVQTVSLPYQSILESTVLTGLQDSSAFIDITPQYSNSIIEVSALCDMLYFSSSYAAGCEIALKDESGSTGGYAFDTINMGSESGQRIASRQCTLSSRIRIQSPGTSQKRIRVQFGATHPSQTAQFRSIISLEAKEIRVIT